MINSQSNDYLQRRIDIIRELLYLFRWERRIYLLVTSVSLILLLFCTIDIIYKEQAEILEIVGLFTSSGGIIYSIGRLLRMWTDAIRLLLILVKKEEQ